MNSENNFEEISKEFPNFLMRYLVVERKEQVSYSWCSPHKKQYQLVVEKPVLQYSTDAGISWKDVPTVVIQK